MPGLFVVGKRKWTDLESRLCASIVYRALVRLDRPVTRDELIKETGVPIDDLLHSLGWMRGKGVDIRVNPGIRGVEESTIELRASGSGGGLRG